MRSSWLTTPARVVPSRRQYFSTTCSCWAAAKLYSPMAWGVPGRSQSEFWEAAQGGRGPVRQRLQRKAAAAPQEGIRHQDGEALPGQGIGERPSAIQPIPGSADVGRRFVRPPRDFLLAHVLESAVTVQGHHARQRPGRPGGLEQPGLRAWPIAHRPGQRFPGQPIAFPGIVHAQIERVFRPGAEAKHLADFGLRLRPRRTGRIQRLLALGLGDPIAKWAEVVILRTIRRGHRDLRSSCGKGS